MTRRATPRKHGGRRLGGILRVWVCVGATAIATSASAESTCNTSALPPTPIDASSALREGSLAEAGWAERALERDRRGDFAGAVGAWSEATATLAVQGPSTDLLDARLGLSRALMARGKLRRAKAELERAAAGARELGDASRAARSLALLAEVLGGLEDSEGARTTMEAAFAALDGVDDPAARARLLFSRGQIEQRSGRSDGAAAAYAESALLARTASDRWLEARAEVSALRASSQAAAREDLAPRVERALARLGGLPDSSEKARLLVHLGGTAVDVAERSDRKGMRAAAARSLAAAADVARRSEDLRTLSYAEGRRAQLYEADGRVEESLVLTRRALFAAHRAGAPESQYRWEWQVGRLQRARGKSSAAIDAYREATATLSLIRSETLLSERGTGGSFETSIAPVYVGLVDLLLERARETADETQQQRLLSEARDVFEALRLEELRNYFEDRCLAQQRSIAPDAVPGSVVIYPIPLPDRTEIVVRLRSGLRSFSVSAGAEEIETEARALRRELQRSGSRLYLKHAARLYELLVAPIEEAVASSDLQTLVFVPSGALGTVPMAALYDRAAGKFLIEKYALAITPGLTLTDPQRIDRGQVRVLTAGLTQSVQGFPPLPRVKDELASVQSEFPAGVSAQLLDADFVEANLSAQVSEVPLGIVHIASHAKFGGSGADSFVLTFDDRISLDRLGQLIAVARFRDAPLELLTLSACQTAAGDDRAALGLAGVALRAGARSAVATLWSVGDAPTAELVSAFYRALRKEGTPRAVALQTAQRELLATEQYRHPAFWSAFLLIGSWI